MNYQSLHQQRNFLSSILSGLSNVAISWISKLGNASLLVHSIILSVFKRPVGFPLLVRQLYVVGVNSLGVVLVTGTFTGLVLTLQAYYQLDDFSTQGMMGNFVSVSVLKELGPMLTAFVLASRIGAATTAELGTMMVTEQVDAMRAMAVNPVKYLVVPRFLACTIMLPVLTIFSSICSILGGYITVVYLFQMNGVFFLTQVKDFIFVSTILISLIKAVAFGMVIAIVGCNRGFSVPSTSGAEGVGKATTGSAVTSLILILIVDFFLNHLMYTVLELK